MVIGNGLLARAFEAYAERLDVLIFASGVSNSAGKDQKEFDRERVLLREALKRRPSLFVYFGTCSVYDASLAGAAYVIHKREMESLVQSSNCDHLIFRLPQVVGETPNPHTLTNFFRDQLMSGERFSVWVKASRTIIDVDDVRTLCDYFIAQPSIRNRAIDLYPPARTTALDLVRLMEHILDVKGDYTLVDRGTSLDFDAPEIIQAATACRVQFTPDYPETVLRKYYGRR